MAAPATDPERVYAIATANRLLTADLLENLTPEQWRTPSLCEGWTVQEVAAHLVPPAEDYSLRWLAKALLKYRFDLARMVDETTREAARQPTAEIVAVLRDRADRRLDPPVTHALGPMTDTCIHLRDIARPLGLDVDPGPESWRPALDFLVSRPAVRGFVPRDRLPRLRFETTDQAWAHGEGPLVRGPSEAVALVMAGRSVALADVDGDGVAELSHRLGAG
ncbi:maleylpyruvate isomerase family mycothiol-dependent enzyme [Nocardioides sp. zg-536]|uniref:Maleylpyruvate isomerase family mycothiol-dependent enzyme n=1 Tax=Nocardioides faecalis TaxID=2803858 RepID=A0A938Y7Q9_9ACTN|nr:maleylpyruvate isomerase family mycothiol-dependent enzyme [Nocardioides faecalis]MBM9460754.1 maleylpyruvate isomerase family mycothiol-dependent enzyme [Nocardioides faecalis]QVI57949.1 maleylpyruvate isomerase family mycothiol-dependent enzyme [Nocardioides faecalis]